MLKRVISLVLSLMMILSLAACGGNSKAASKNGPEYIFYMKDGATYYTTDAGATEKKLHDNKVTIVFSQKDNYILYFEEKGNLKNFYIKNTDSNNDSILIAENVDRFLTSDILKLDKVFAYRVGDTLYAYYIDTNESVKINDGRVRTFGYSIKNDVIYYGDYSKVQDIPEIFATYNVKTRERKETLIGTKYIAYYFEYNSGVGDECVVYLNSVVEEKGAYSKSNLYKIVPGLEPVLIDTIEGKGNMIADHVYEIQYSHKKFGAIKTAGDHLFYTKLEDDSKSVNFQEKMYYYDGNNIHLLNEQSLFGSSWKTYYKNNEDYVAGVEYYIGENNLVDETHREFFVGEKKYEGTLINHSNEKHLVYYNKDDKSYVKDLIKGSDKELKYKIDEVLWINDNKVDHLLYATNNKEAVLDDKIIATNLDSSLYHYNDDLSMILFDTTDGMCLYNKGESTIITKSKDAVITNNDNIYYTEDGKLYLYKNKKSELILENVSEAIMYYSP